MWILITLVLFLFSYHVSNKINHILVNPLLISMCIIALILNISDTSYDSYFKSNMLVHQCLKLAVVALAIPLYSNLPFILSRWKQLLFASLFSSLLVIGSTLTICWFMDLNANASAVLIPKSVTMPIALSITESLGGETSLTVLMVVVSSWVGVLAAYPIFKALNIASPIARGIAIGSVSHILGTAKAAQVNESDAAISTIAFIFCGVLTSILGPAFYYLVF